MKRSTGYLTLAMTALLAVGNVGAQAWTAAYTSPTATGDCAGLPAAIASDTSLFAIEPIISRAMFTDTAVGVTRVARVTKLAFWLNPVTKKADIFVGERGSTKSGPSPARISYYDASATPPTLKVIGTFPGAYIGFAESGVLGLAVNPMTFDQDNFLYVLYATGSAASPSATNGWRVSRFKLAPVTRMMDMGSEKILLHIPAGTANRWHTGTSMRFDNFGNLYIGAADNEATSNGPANTADFRGGILRIKIDSTAAKGYTIPANNFGSYWAQKWQDSGLTARATAYRDTAIVKPEIYVKGSRNPYSFGIDPNRLGWLAWSECGPDRTNERGEEHNFTTTPAFSGWPFWVGTGTRQSGYASSYDEAGEPKSDTAWLRFNPTSMNTRLPINNQPSQLGYDTLPPMHIPYTTQSSGCAIGGPIVRYDGRIGNPGQLPPHLNNVILSFNMSGNWYGMKIDPATSTTTGTATTVFTMTKSGSLPSLANMSEIVQGPDGVLYGVDQSETCCGDRGLNGTKEGVVKLRYKGTCRDTALAPVAIQGQKNLGRGLDVEWLRVGSTSFSLTAPGPHQASILDVSGRVLKEFRGEGHKTYYIPSLGTGIHVLRIKTTEGTISRSLAAGGL
jgi:hypothetical protein